MHKVEILFMRLSQEVVLMQVDNEFKALVETDSNVTTAELTDRLYFA